MAYLEDAVDTSDLRQDMSDTIHFMTYKMNWDDMQNCFKLKESKWLSTDLSGINKILAGANPDQYLTEREFLNNAIRKGQEDGVLE